MGCFWGPSSDEDREQNKRNSKINQEIKKAKQTFKSTHRLLLLGLLLEFIQNKSPVILNNS